MSFELAEEQEERAAILEYDAGYSREEAERMAVEMSAEAGRILAEAKQNPACAIDLVALALEKKGGE